jgi:hypothetical protein
MLLTPDTRRLVAQSMRHKHRNGHRLQHIAGHAPQNDLVQPGVAIATNHDQRSGNLGDVRQDRVGDVDVGRPDCYDLNLDVMACEMRGDLSAANDVLGAVRLFVQYDQQDAVFLSE